MTGGRRVVKVLAGGLIVVLVADTLRARGRLARLDLLRPTGPPDDLTDDFELIAATGVSVPDTVRASAAAFAEQEDLDVLELVPGNLPPEEALELAAQVDPGTVRGDRLALGRGAFRALLVRRAVLDRSTVAATDDLDPAAFVAAHTDLKHLAPASSDLVVVPDLFVPPVDLDRRRAQIEALFGAATPAVLALPVLQWTIIAAALIVAPAWGAAALAAYCAQPVVAVAGSPLAGSDLASAGLARWWREPRRWARTLAGRWRPPAVEDPVESRREGYREALADGLDRFFEPRRVDCPLCGGTDLSVRLETTDIFQYKPGRFVLEACAGCGHVFQNPRLSEAGLEFYYRDFYDGLGEESSELIFGATSQSYVDRAEMVRGQAEPGRWLDVGAGHGHFCLVARDVWPDTTFDGLDLSDSIDEAARRGWVDTGYHGLFPDMASDLAGAYDVVSMHHYLEHTREPATEIDAAVTTLAPGGHLLIELPDPESPFGRLLGRWWIPWFQPQHQHLLSVANLSELLDERGFDVVAVHRGEAHQTVDFFIALWLRLNAIAPPEMPWRRPRTTARRWGRRLVLTVGAPALLLAAAVDQALAPIIRRRGGSNTYRVLARLRP